MAFTIRPAKLLVGFVAFIGLSFAQPAEATRPARNWGPPTGEKLREHKSKPRVWRHVKGVTSTAKSSQWYPKKKARAASQSTKSVTKSATMANTAKTPVKRSPPVVPPPPEVQAPEESSDLPYSVAFVMLALFAFGASGFIVYRQGRQREATPTAETLEPISKEAILHSEKEIYAAPSGLEGLSVSHAVSGIGA